MCVCVCVGVGGGACGLLKTNKYYMALMTMFVEQLMGKDLGVIVV